MKTDTLNRRSRRSRTGGKPIEEPTGTHKAIFRVLNRYRYLPVTYIAPLIGKHPLYVQKLVSELSRSPNNFLEIASDCFDVPTNSIQWFYGNTDKAREVLATEHLDVADRSTSLNHHFKHQLMIDTFAASLQLAATPRLGHKSEILATAKFPHKQRNKKYPFSFEVPDKRKQKGKYPTYDYIPDEYLFLEQYNLRLHMQIEAENTGQSFGEKFDAIEYVMRNKKYDECWGVGNLVTLVLTREVPPYKGAQLHKQNHLIETLLKKTKNKGATHVLTTEVPMFGRKLEPIKNIYTRPWHRAGHDDISLKELFDGRK